MKKNFFGNKIGHIFGILAREVSDQHVSFKVRLSSLFRITKGIWKIGTNLVCVLNFPAYNFSLEQMLCRYFKCLLCDKLICWSTTWNKTLYYTIIYPIFQYINVYPSFNGMRRQFWNEDHLKEISGGQSCWLFSLKLYIYQLK